MGRLQRVVVAAATILALYSAWHGGGHAWHRLTALHQEFAGFTEADRRHATAARVGMPADVFDWYSQYLVRGDRVYYQVEQSPFSGFTDIPTLIQELGDFLLLPSVQVTDLKRATVVVSFFANPAELGVHFITQQEAGLQPIYVSRISSP